MFFQLTPLQFAAIIKAIHKDIKKDNPVILLYRKIDDDNFEIETIDSFLIFRYDPAAERMFASVGYKKSLAAQMASDDQIFIHAFSVLFNLVKSLPAEPTPQPVIEPPSPPGTPSHAGAKVPEPVKAHDVKPPEDKKPEDKK